MSTRIKYFMKVFKEKKYAEDFIKGNIRFGKLGYYQDIECIRGDNRENLTANLDSSKYELILKRDTEEIKILAEDLVGPIQMQHYYLNDHYIYCLASVKTDNSKNIMILPERERLEKFGKHIVLIHKPKGFVEQLKKVLKEKEESFLLNIGEVKYKDFNSNFFHLEENERGFIKDETYNGENEFRFKLIKNNSDEDFISYEIGDLRDLAIYCEFKDLKINGVNWEW